MKIPGILLLIILASSCDCDHQRVSSQKSTEDSTIFAMPESTAYPVENAKLDFGFYYDTLYKFDVPEHFDFSADFPQAMNTTTFGPLNQKIVTVVNEIFQMDVNFDTVTPVNGNAQIWTHSFFMDQQLVSICIADQSYTEGAANYNHDFQGINYNPVTNKFLLLGDIISINDYPEDVLETINNKVSSYRDTFKNLNKLYAEKEFYINDEGLFMYGWESFFKVLDITDVRRYRKG